MQFPGIKLRLEYLVHPLLALNTAFAGEFFADNQRLKMTTIAVKFELFAGQARAYQLFDLIRMHKGSGS